MTTRTSVLVLALLPLVLAAGWGGIQALCDGGNSNAMFGRLGPPLWGGIFGAMVGCGFMVLGLCATWFKQYSDNLQSPQDRSRPVVSAVGWGLCLGVIGATALGISAPSTRFFWYASGSHFPTRPLTLIGYGIIGGAIIGAVVGVIVGFTGAHGRSDDGNVHHDSSS